MKRAFLYIIVATIALTLTSCHKKSGDTASVKLNSKADTISWALGESLANAVLDNELGLDNEVMVEAFRTTLNGGEQPFNDTIYQLAVAYISTLSMHKQQEKIQRMQDNAKDIFAQLEENPNIKKAPEGFYYEIVRPGKGRNANYGERVLFDYKGFNMLTGQLTDQTYGNRDAILHVIGNPMFPGLIAGLQLMNAGSIYRFYFPSELAFGATGTQNIPPHTPVIYEVELHKVYDD